LFHFGLGFQEPVNTKHELLKPPSEEYLLNYHIYQAKR